jgi:hypothetical protein
LEKDCRVSCQSVSQEENFFLSSLPFRQKQLSERHDVVIVGLFILGDNGMPDKASTAARLERWVEGLSSPQLTSSLLTF